MTLHKTVGWLGSAMLALCPIPQAIESYQLQSSDGLSWAFLGLWAVGELLLLGYTIPLKLWPLVINYVLNLSCLAVVIWFKL